MALDPTKMPNIRKAIPVRRSSAPASFTLARFSASAASVGRLKKRGTREDQNEGLATRGSLDPSARGRYADTANCRRCI